jgi:hypothetical protein
VFELGLFIGRLGRERCFIVLPDGADKVKFPTDLTGLAPGFFQPDGADANLVASLGACCNRIRQRIRELGPLKTSTPLSADQSPVAKYEGEDALSVLESWMGKRDHQQNGRSWFSRKWTNCSISNPDLRNNTWDRQRSVGTIASDERPARQFCLRITGS